MKRVLMLLANGVEPLEMSAFTDVLGWATLVGSEPIELVDAGLRRNIKTTFGLNLIPNCLLSELDVSEFDALAIPGGFEPSGFYEEALSAEFLEVIRYFADAGKPIASVCVSSLCLGSAGVLENKPATIYHQVGGKRKAQLEEIGAQFVDQPIVVHQQLITSTGPGTALEVAFKLLEMLTDADNVTALKDRMRIPPTQAAWYFEPQV